MDGRVVDRPWWVLKDIKAENLVGFIYILVFYF